MSSIIYIHNKVSWTLVSTIINKKGTHMKSQINLQRIKVNGNSTDGYEARLAIGTQTHNHRQFKVALIYTTEQSLTDQLDALEDVAIERTEAALWDEDGLILNSWDSQEFQDVNGEYHDLYYIA